jgi:deoxyribodipyrimidine photo-lyase
LKSGQTPHYNIVWFKRDLRLHDHAPLSAAVEGGHPVVGLYIIEPDYWGLPDVSRRHWHFIHDCLLDLDVAFRKLGGRLIIRVGGVVDVLEDLRQQFGQFALYSHEETGSRWTFQRDIQVGAWCRQCSINWQEYPSNGVVRRLGGRDGWQKLRDGRMGRPALVAPNIIIPLAGLETGVLPNKDDALFGCLSIGTVQEGGRTVGLDVLTSFLKERSQKYMITISKPGISARHCSRLSGHIAYGSLSIREIEQATKVKIANLAGFKDAAAVSHQRNLRAFLSRLAWRCHFVQKLEQQPDIEFSCMHSAFEGMREPYHDEAKFSAWKEGRTGYPLIDAAMRSLHDNGWITFRMRAMLVSFASYHLWLDWRVSAPFMAQLFTDYEPGIHYSQFQMQSGVTGMNAIRMYSPVKQSLDHDPEGKFIRRYVPELAGVSPQWIHEPWRMETPPTDYASPIVEHARAIAFARQEIGRRWKGDGFRDVAKQIVKKLGSRNRQPKRKATSKKSSQLEFDL